MVHKVNLKQLFTNELEVDGPAQFDGDVTMNGAVNIPGGVVSTGRQLWVPALIGGDGSTAGWTVADDAGLVLCPAAETTVTWVIPLLGLHIGDTLQGVSVIGQAESVGGDAGPLVLSVRKGIAAVADFTDAELDTDTTGVLTADTLISSAGAPLLVTALAEVLAEGEYLYALLTATTAASTDFAVSGLIVDYDQS